MHLANRAHLAKQLCTAAIFGLTLASVLDRAEVDRDLDVLELWSGVGSIVRARSRWSYNARGFDIRNSEYEDITTPAGFKHAVNLVLQLVVGGLLWMAPVCSSFTFMNSSNCMRRPSNDHYGDTNYPSVIEGNLMARIAAFLFALAWARGVDVAIENPPGSCIWKFPPLKNILDGINSTFELADTITHRCAFDPLPPGKRYFKPFRFVATAGWINETRRPCSCGTAGHKELARSWIGKDGLKKVTGHSEELKASSAYPDKLGETIVAAWHGSRLAPGVTESKPPSGDEDEEGAQRMRMRRVPKPPGVTESNPWQHASSEDEEGAQTASSKPKEAAASTQTRSWCQCHSEDETDTKKMRAIRSTVRSTVPKIAPLKRRRLSWEQCSSQDEDTKPVASKPRTRGVLPSRCSSQHAWQCCSNESE